MSLCLITGAAGGIGGVVARNLARRGMNLHLTDRPGSALSEVAAACPGATWSFHDLSRDEEVASLFEQLDETPGVVFNSIGKGVMGSFESLPVEAYRDSLALNFFVPLLVNLTAMRAWKAQEKPGRLLTVSSVSGHRAYPSSIAYGIAKHALEASMTVFHKAGLPINVFAGTVCPTNIDTGFWQNVETFGDVSLPDESRMVSADEVADACVSWIESTEPPRHVFIPQEAATVPTPYGHLSPELEQYLAENLASAGHKFPPPSGVALITGASSGLGLELSRALAAEGWRVVGLARDRDRLRQQLVENGGPLDRCYEGDVGDQRRMEEIVAETVAAYGSVDLLVNNAGATKIGWIYEFPNADIKRIFNTNFFGYLHPTRAALRPLIENRGILLNILSITAQNPAPVSLPYSCAKAAQAALSDALRHDLTTKGVRVVDVFPGNTRTDFFARAESVNGEPVIAPANAMDPKAVVDQIVHLLLRSRCSSATIVE
jgi:short-subunit dehydrogenase